MKRTIAITAVGMALASAATGTAAVTVAGGVWGPARLTASAQHQATEIAALQRQVALLERAVPVAGTCKAYRLALHPVLVQGQVATASGWQQVQVPVLSSYVPNALTTEHVLGLPVCGS